MGVDLDQAQGGDGLRFRARHGIDGQVVAFMGALTDDKGVVHLLRAMQCLWDAGSDATLVVAGQPLAPSTFEQVYQALPDGHRQRIRRLGVVDGQLKQDMLAATDLFAMPSRVDSFGIVYLEAWAYGLPVIGCRAGGVPGVIEDGQDGLLVPYGDLVSLTSALDALLSAPDLRLAMGARGRAKVEARYTWNRIYDQLQAMYRALVAASPAAEPAAIGGPVPAPCSGAGA
jgi:glycosyltransferase involved in cell wall biosynthesis